MKNLPHSWTVKDGALHCEDVSLEALAEMYGTPTYIYSQAHITDAFSGLSQGLPFAHTLCFSVKANSNLSVLKLLHGLGAGFDIVSVGELRRVVLATGSADNVVFSGVGKREDEMAEALAAGIRCFNVESVPELELLNQVAIQAGKRAPVALRLNPNVDPKTHPYISTGLQENKFGIAHEECLGLYKQMATMDGIEIVGLDCHIGSQLLDPAPMLHALERVLEVADAIMAAGISLQHLDLGGGFGIAYDDEELPDWSHYGQQVATMLGDRGLHIIYEPGRSIVGNAGALLTKVLYTKTNGPRTFVIVDAAMNDLARPSLYSAYQRILPTAQPDRCSESEGTANIVGPICESGDFLGKDRDLAFVTSGDYLAVLSSGAYGFVMASNYNTRGFPAEVLVSGERHRVVRRRQSVDELIEAEVSALGDF